MLSENSLQKVLYAIKELIPNSIQCYQRQMLKKTSETQHSEMAQTKKPKQFSAVLNFH